MHLPNPDWLQHALTAIGPEDSLAAFVAAARGSGYPAWLIDYDDVAEELFHRMIAPANQGLPLSVSFKGAQIIARQYRELMMEANHRNQARAGHAKDIPLDLNALVPVPWEVLRLGERDPKAEAWMWEHWGTLWPLRRVQTIKPLTAHLTGLQPSDRAAGYSFVSADWTPWPAIAAIRKQWPALRFRLSISYERYNPISSEGPGPPAKILRAPKPKSTRGRGKAPTLPVPRRGTRAA